MTEKNEKKNGIALSKITHQLCCSDFTISRKVRCNQWRELKNPAKMFEQPSGADHDLHHFLSFSTKGNSSLPINREVLHYYVKNIIPIFQRKNIYDRKK